VIRAKPGDKLVDLSQWREGAFRGGMVNAYGRHRTVGVFLPQCPDSGLVYRDPSGRRIDDCLRFCGA
jgi:hypothetical protein